MEILFYAGIAYLTFVTLGSALLLYWLRTGDKPTQVVAAAPKPKPSIAHIGLGVIVVSQTEMWIGKLVDWQIIGTNRVPVVSRFKDFAKRIPTADDNPDALITKVVMGPVLPYQFSIYTYLRDLDAKARYEYISKMILFIKESNE